VRFGFTLDQIRAACERRAELERAHAEDDLESERQTRLRVAERGRIAAERRAHEQAEAVGPARPAGDGSPPPAPLSPEERALLRRIRTAAQRYFRGSAYRPSDEQLARAAALSVEQVTALRLRIEALARG
jgi:hypothetical protein